MIRSQLPDIHRTAVVVAGFAAVGTFLTGTLFLAGCPVFDNPANELMGALRVGVISGPLIFLGAVLVAICSELVMEDTSALPSILPPSNIPTDADHFTDRLVVASFVMQTSEISDGRCTDARDTFHLVCGEGVTPRLH
jgi:hypothetical protein